MKYIMFIDETFVILPRSQNHSDYAGSKVPISAGYLIMESYRNQYDDIRYRVSCYGQSDSMGLSSRKDDSEIIQRQLSVNMT